MSKLNLVRKLAVILIGLAAFGSNLWANLPVCKDGCTPCEACCGKNGNSPGGSDGSSAPGRDKQSAKCQTDGGGGGGGGGGGLSGGLSGPLTGLPGGGNKREECKPNSDPQTPPPSPTCCCGNGDGNGGTPTTGSVLNTSVNISINFGRPANENINVISQFSIYSKAPAATLFTPANLQYRNYLLDKISQNLNNGRQIKIFTTDRKMLEFNFADGSSTATLSGELSFLNYKLKMVDANGNETATAPVYYDLYMGNGFFIRYSKETGRVVFNRTSAGRILTPSSPSVGLEMIYDDYSIIRQVWSLADGLADVVIINDLSYEIRFYSPANAGTKSGKYYVPTGTPHTVWKIENPTPGQLDKVKVTKTVNNSSEVYLYVYSYAVESWVLYYPGGQTVSSKSSSWNSTRTVRTETSVMRTDSGSIGSKTINIYQNFSFGDRLVTKIEDPDGANQRTSYTYDGNGKIATVSLPDGGWESYQYDTSCRVIEAITPWKNSPINSPASAARAKYYSYTPLDSRDTLTPDDQRPRTVEEKVLGITVSKTYYAYYYDNGQYVKVEEHCSTAGAVYGDSSNLRTERRYYAVGDCTSASAGRLYRQTSPDGVIKTYSYEYGNWTADPDPAQSAFTPGSGSAVRMSIVYGTAAQPDGIANKTIKDVVIYDERGNEAMRESHAYTGSGYVRVYWDAFIYDELNRLTTAYSANGTQSSFTWNCCSKESETLSDGTQYAYAYDALKRMTSKTKIGTGGQPNLVTSYTYNAAGKRLSSTVSAGGLSLVESTEYNPAGEVTKRTDSRGLVTTYTYLDGVNTGSVKGEITTATLPSGYLSTTENYLDGQSFAVTGNAVIAEYYDYGVNADGSKWTMVRAGRNDSARWQKTTTNLLSRTVKTERSGFGGTVIVQNFYNSNNQLVKTMTTGQADTLYVYDEIGNLVRTGLDINANGTLDLASTDRISEQETAFAQETGDWWLVKTNKVYASGGSDVATTTVTTKTRMTGFSSNTVAEVKAVDINGNITTQTTTVDRNNKTVTVNTASPVSSVAAQIVSVNGLKTSERTTSNLTTTYAYDGLGRQTGITDPRTGTTTTAYYTDGLGKKGQIYTITDAAGNISTYDYDTAGRLGSVKNAINKYTYYAYNALGKITRTWGDADYPVEQIFDNFGQMTQLKTYRAGTGWNESTWPTEAGDAELTQWTFDEASGLLTAKIYADGKSTAYTYSVDGKLSTRTWARQVNSQPLVTTYGYNAATGEMTSVAYSDGTAGITYAYNRLGQKSQVTDAVGTRTFAYNDKLQPLTETITGLYSKTLTRNYAVSGVTGRYTGMNIGSEYAVNYGYDTYGRLNSVGSGSDTFSYGYLASSNLVSSVTRPGNLTTDYSYETNRDLITAIANKYNGSTTVSAYGYSNDAVGRRTGMSRTGTAFATADTLAYGYNDRNEVTSAASDNIPAYNYGFTFDNIGNRVTASEAGIALSYTSNQLNQYLTVTGSANPAYDFDANMTSDGSGWAYAWDAENRLKSATNDNQTLEFKYDYMSRRIEKKVTDSGTISKQERFVYDEFKQIEKLDALNNNAISQKFVWQPKAVGLDVVLSMTNADGAFYYTHDASKNISELIAPTGIIKAHYEYSPFGKIVKQTGDNADVNPFRFSCEYFDSETGLVYYNYRYYSPEMGRWLSRDPIEERGGVNLYEMVKNDSINKWDWLGREWYEYVPIIGTIASSYPAEGENSADYADLAISPKECQTMECDKSKPDASYIKAKVEAECQGKIQARVGLLLKDPISQAVNKSGVGVGTTALALLAGPVGWWIGGVAAVDDFVGGHVQKKSNDRIRNASKQAMEKYCQCP